jgi:hypothetical protein
MSTDRRDEPSQLLLDFERCIDSTVVANPTKDTGACHATSVSKLTLVVNNHFGLGTWPRRSPPGELSPNSPEITRILATQAEALRW